MKHDYILLSTTRTSVNLRKTFLLGTVEDLGIATRIVPTARMQTIRVDIQINYLEDEEATAAQTFSRDWVESTVYVTTRGAVRPSWGHEVNQYKYLREEYIHEVERAAKGAVPIASTSDTRRFKAVNVGRMDLLEGPQVSTTVMIAKR